MFKPRLLGALPRQDNVVPSTRIALLKTLLLRSYISSTHVFARFLYLWWHHSLLDHLLLIGEDESFCNIGRRLASVLSDSRCLNVHV